jgi:hypothetical protein
MYRIKQYATKLSVFTLFIVLGFLSFSTFTSKAQWWTDEDDYRNFLGGVVLGSNFSQVTGDFAEGYNKLGLNGGVATYFKLTNQFYGSMELLFSQRGAIATGSKELPYWNVGNTVPYKTYKSILPYAEVPVLFNFFEKNKSHLGAGFSYGQLFSEKELATDPNGTVVSFQQQYPYKKWDVCFVVNGNLRMYKGLYLNLRFNHSVANIRAQQNTVFNHRTVQHHKMFSARLMWLF